MALLHFGKTLSAPERWSAIAERLQQHSPFKVGKLRMDRCWGTHDTMEVVLFAARKLKLNLTDPHVVGYCDLLGNCDMLYASPRDGTALTLRQGDKDEAAIVHADWANEGFDCHELEWVELDIPDDLEEDNRDIPLYPTGGGDYYTQPCWFYQNLWCVKGSGCPFLHPKD
eukprot:TRINITY_DN76209_c0_g1_i1.p1 TRINITY_DN76209_c0_g1~~TRINITY_DN76209_c0_g1_i1.p1  ORF type:complete len:170 (+),score=20.48 TRINITY_DN76209_c0_g1_i1:150-659(+)